MNKNPESSETPKVGEMLAEYDFSPAVRGVPRYPSNSFRARIETQTGDRSVIIKTVQVNAIVNPNGEVTIQLPPDIAPGEHRMTLLIEIAQNGGQY